MKGSLAMSNDAMDGQTCGIGCQFLYAVVCEDWVRAAELFDRLLVSPILVTFSTLLGEKLNPEGDKPELSHILGEDLETVLQSGFRTCSLERFRRIIADPRLYIELQEQVFISGSDYFMALCQQDPELQAVSQRILQKLQAQLFPDTDH